MWGRNHKPLRHVQFQALAGVRIMHECEAIAKLFPNSTEIEVMTRTQNDDACGEGHEANNAISLKAADYS